MNVEFHRWHDLARGWFMTATETALKTADRVVQATETVADDLSKTCSHLVAPESTLPQSKSV